MPGVDHDSLALFKEAKSGKKVFFALVVKGGTVGKLMASKSKITPGEITEAKKEVGGSAVVQGRCHGENGGLIFETVKDTAPAITSLTKKLLKDGGWNVDVEYRTNTEAETDGTPGTTTTTTGPQIGQRPTPPQRTPPPRPTPTTTSTPTTTRRLKISRSIRAKSCSRGS